MFKDQTERALSDFSTPFSSDSAEVTSTVEVNGVAQTERTSLNGMAAWINSWASQEEWVQEGS